MSYCYPAVVMGTLVEMEELAEVIDRRMGGRAGSACVRPAVSFARIDRASTRLSGERLPGIAVVVQGAKALRASGRTYTSRGASYLVSTDPVLAEVEVLEARASRPFLGMVVDVDRARLGRLMVDMAEQHSESPPPTTTLASGSLDRAMARALLRLAHLACSDAAWGALHEGAIREVYYWTLASEAGPLLRHGIARAAGVERVARAVRFIEAHLSEPLEVAAIAHAAALSPSALHACFKRVLGEPPMQLVKRLRLEQARAQIAAGEGVTTAAFDVGYASPSQFSRDFRRHFGLAPSRLRPPR